MKKNICPRCKGTGWDGCHNHTPDYDKLPFMLKPIGVWRCGVCGGTGKIPEPLFNVNNEELKKIIEDIQGESSDLLERK